MADILRSLVAASKLILGDKEPEVFSRLVDK
jgi:hypothetical protein